MMRLSIVVLAIFAMASNVNSALAGVVKAEPSEILQVHQANAKNLKARLTGRTIDFYVQNRRLGKGVLRITFYGNGTYARTARLSETNRRLSDRGRWSVKSGNRVCLTSNAARFRGVRCATYTIKGNRVFRKGRGNRLGRYWGRFVR